MAGRCAGSIESLRIRIPLALGPCRSAHVVASAVGTTGYGTKRASSAARTIAWNRSRLDVRFRFIHTEHIGAHFDPVLFDACITCRAPLRAGLGFALGLALATGLWRGLPQARIPRICVRWPDIHEIGYVVKDGSSAGGTSSPTRWPPGSAAVSTL